MKCMDAEIAADATMVGKRIGPVIGATVNESNHGMPLSCLADSHH